MRKLRPGVPKAVLDPKSAMLMLGLASKTLMLSEWTAGPCSCKFNYERRTRALVRRFPCSMWLSPCLEITFWERCPSWSLLFLHL